MSHLRSFYVSEKIEPISAGNQEIMALLLFRLSVVSCFRSTSVSHEYFEFDMKLIETINSMLIN